jgi:hypothetical protein
LRFPVFGLFLREYNRYCPDLSFLIIEPALKNFGRFEQPLHYRRSVLIRYRAMKDILYVVSCFERTIFLPQESRCT